jgi:O-methyltransferase involved in polyketide biosynthesis
VERLLQPPEHYPLPHYIAADLSRVPLAEVLSSCPLFNPNLPTLFTVEGLVYYLPHAAVQQLVGGIAEVAAPGSVVCFDFLHKWV